MLRIADGQKAFIEAVKDRRKRDYEVHTVITIYCNTCVNCCVKERMEAFKTRFMEQQSVRLEERRKKRIEERRATYYREKEEELRRQKEEEERASKSRIWNLC